MTARSFWLWLWGTSRWDEYAHVIEVAQQRGYVVSSLLDWYRHYRHGNEKMLILRHDVDYDVLGAYRMLHIEERAGVHSTFYFRWTTADTDLITKIRRAGSEVGFHYETLSRYAILHNLTERSQITEGVIWLCKAMLVEEIVQFQARFGPIISIAAHGSVRNRELSISDDILVEGQNLAPYGIEFTAYGKDILVQFDDYISDAWGGGWHDDKSPIQSLDQDLRTICLLTHPNNWNYGLAKDLHQLQRCVLRRIGKLKVWSTRH